MYVLKYFYTDGPHAWFIRDDYVKWKIFNWDRYIMGLSDEEIIPLPLDRDMLDESMSSDAGGSLSRYGSDEELDRDDPF